LLGIAAARHERQGDSNNDKRHFAGLHARQVDQPSYRAATAHGHEFRPTLPGAQLRGACARLQNRSKLNRFVIESFL
jgi:hypothetical protein